MDDPFANFSDADRAELSEWITEELDAVIDTSQILDILAVICGKKPGAYIARLVAADSDRPIVGLEYGDWDVDSESRDPIGEFLDTYGVEYRRESDAWGETTVLVKPSTDTSERVTERVETTRYRYYLSDDPNRLAALPSDPPDAELGQFLGFPPDAIEAFTEGRSYWKRYRTQVRGMYAATSGQPSTYDFVRFFESMYAPSPTVDGLEQAWIDMGDRIEFREAVDEALDVDNRFSLAFYRDCVTGNSFHLDNPRLLWWLFWYRLRAELSSPRNVAGAVLKYIHWRMP